MLEQKMGNAYLDFHYKRMRDVIYGYVIVVCLYINLYIHIYLYFDIYHIKEILYYKYKFSCTFSYKYKKNVLYPMILYLMSHV